MAVLNGSSATESFDMIDLSEIDFASEDGGGVNSTTQYSWLTTNGHDVQTTGSGITFSGGAPTGGTVTAIDIDLSNNDFLSPDIVITGVNNASLVTITNTSADFLNTVFGGDDTMTGTPFGDQLKGVGGDDSIDGGAGGDTIFGGAGADTLAGGDGSDSLLGEAGADFLSDDLIGNDTLNGGDDDDVVSVVSSIASDSFDGGAGTDWVDWTTSTQSGATFDLAAGTAVSGMSSETMANFENLKGTGGADNILGTTGANYLVGGGGNDTLDGLDGVDTLEGNDGDDSINDAAGSDLMSGGAGDDTFIEADLAGVDTISGGADDDYVFVGSSIGSDSFAGDAGVDTIDWSTSSQSGGTFNLAAGTASNGIFSETMTNFENLKGTGGDDTIVGSANLNDLMGLGGNDSISGGASADTITGGAGNDTLDGGTAFDTVSYADKSGGVNVNVINGVALTGGFVNSAGFYQGGTQEDTISNFENIFGTDYNDRLIAGSTSAIINGEDGNDYLYTFSGNDTLYGGSGNDYISTALSTDHLYGETGNDTLNGGTGMDTLDGGADTDTADYSDRTGAVSVNVGSGVAYSGGALNAGGFYVGGFAEDSLVSMENITGSAFGDRLVGSGVGSYISGGAGGDSIASFSGNDTISGGDGNDTITGGAGNDRFFFSLGHDADTITDFNGGAGVGDVIKLFGFGAAFDTFGEVIAAATQVGGDTVINFGGGNTLTLTGVLVGNLAANDFEFG